MRRYIGAAMAAAAILVAAATTAGAQDAPMQFEPPEIERVDELTLDRMVRNGGPILWVIIALGFVAFVMGVYLFLTVTSRREAPPKLMQRAANQIRAGDVRGAYLMCENRDELIAKVLYAGLKMADQERYIIQESMESEGERGAALLWQKNIIPEQHRRDRAPVGSARHGMGDDKCLWRNRAGQCASQGLDHGLQRVAGDDNDGRGPAPRDTRPDDLLLPSGKSFNRHFTS